MKKMLIYWKVPLFLCCLAVALEFFCIQFPPLGIVSVAG